jgi:hypothetical protein
MLTILTMVKLVNLNQVYKLKTVITKSEGVSVTVIRKLCITVTDTGS